MATTHASQPAGWSDALAVLVDAIERLWTRFRSWRARRETVHQLHSVDSATLRELGISPEEIRLRTPRRSRAPLRSGLVAKVAGTWGASSEHASESSSRSRGARFT
jgi:uncharacterized protein YjiS (DUF1127 family)